MTEHEGVTAENEGGENQEKSVSSPESQRKNEKPDDKDFQDGKKRTDFQKVKRVSEESGEEKSTESLMKPETESSPGTIPLRKLERKKRDDSLESNTASVKSSVQLSDTGSLLSHR